MKRAKMQKANEVQYKRWLIDETDEFADLNGHSTERATITATLSSLLEHSCRAYAEWSHGDLDKAAPNSSTVLGSPFGLLIEFVFCQT